MEVHDNCVFCPEIVPLPHVEHQRSPEFLNEQRLLGEEQIWCTFKLTGLDFEMQYRPGVENKAADALSH